MGKLPIVTSGVSTGTKRRTNPGRQNDESTIGARSVTAQRHFVQHRTSGMPHEFPFSFRPGLGLCWPTPCFAESKNGRNT
jgi:hypothetical protein